MIKEYLILRVFNGKKVKTYDYRKKFREYGFDFIKKSYNKSYWELKVEKTEKIKYIEEIKKHFEDLGFKVFFLSSNDIRSNNYRNIFFENNKGIKGYYICSYCGLIISKEKVSVDHILPINKTFKSKPLKLLKKFLKIENINDYKNLAPACKRCNSKKGSKTGLWIIRGFLGRNLWSWIILYISLIIILSIVMYTLFFY